MKNVKKLLALCVTAGLMTGCVVTPVEPTPVYTDGYYAYPATTVSVGVVEKRHGYRHNGYRNNWNHGGYHRGAYGHHGNRYYR